MKRPLGRHVTPRARRAGAFCVGEAARIKVPPLIGACVGAALFLTAVMMSVGLAPSQVVAQIGGGVCLPVGVPFGRVDVLGQVALPVDSTAPMIPSIDSVAPVVPSIDPVTPAVPPIGAVAPGVESIDSVGPLGPPSDSVGRDPLLAGADSIEVPADSARVVPRTLPAIKPDLEPSYGLGIWCWDRESLLSTRAITLAELVSLIPGVIALKGGDYGTPVTAMAFGVGGDRIRVLWDGFEWMPLDGAAPDLSRIGLAGLDEVRVERHPGELRITLRTSEPTGPDPTSLVHVGTGDLGTNLLRGVFVHPNAFGGAFTFALDRVDTRGPGLNAAGSLSGFVLRYALTRGERGGIVAEIRRFAPRTDVMDLATGLSRSDWNLKARWLFAEGLVGEAYWGASSLSGGIEDPIYGGLDTRRTQIGLRTKYTVGNLWVQSSARRFSGHGVPRENYEVAGGGTHGSGATLDGSLRGERWAGEVAASWRVRIQTPSIKGFSLFAAYEDGQTGAPFVSEYEAYLRSFRLGPPVAANPIDKPRPRFTDRTGIRAGGTFTWGSFDVSAALLSVKADSLRPLGIDLDPDGISLEGGKRTGFEARASIPLPLSGFELEGAVQAWDAGLAYLPRRLWDGALTYHGVFKESRNLELWSALGVTHRDLMTIGILVAGGDASVPDLVEVPLSEEWYFNIQVRIVTLNLFIRWENVTGRGDNVDFPNRTQPRIRTLYGVRWIMNN